MNRLLRWLQRTASLVSNMLVLHPACNDIQAYLSRLEEVVEL